MKTRSPSAALASPIHASSSSAVAEVYRSGSGDWSRNMWLNPHGSGVPVADGADSLVAQHGDVVPGADMSPDTRPALTSRYRTRPPDVQRSSDVTGRL